MNDIPDLLTATQKLCYRILPMKLYAAIKARRNLRRYEPELSILPLLVDPNRTSVDAGANRGSYTYFLSRLSQHVYAYEPNPAMRWILKRVAAENVTVSKAALSDESGIAEFAVPKSKTFFRNNAGSLEVDQLAEASPDLVRFQVPTARLDDLGVSNVGFMKIDVEGHERKVLLGAQRVIERDHPVLLIEMMDSLTQGELRESVEFVERRGYRSFLIVDKRIIDYRLAVRMNHLTEVWDRHNPHVRSNNILFLPIERQKAAA
ncbi:FkbM family methyltransferase [Bythopirellula polymerisocia]|uniref:Methyltransferase FkbM domain-containing protein n=1 Tax=Bythopirellula polymerisocia TaxID=2528003 RepID=A0A5C6CZT4_9BACT|nr:FkbM family methyltransferase [Bythopirellula polymerisocia]TWU28179.1 hypothetical protein Pla144_14660 [Bythopirellula polymerisocia]